MKRSRTCMNLVELDAPAAPKRTCSLPNLSWNGASRSIKQNHRDTLLFLKQQHALSSALSRGAAVPSPPAVAAEGRSFVVESIVHSKGCLNAITIVEGQEWSGETGAPQPGGSPVSLFGGAMHGSLFEDCGDSSDYFCGVASSDEAEEEDSNDAGAAMTAAEAVVSDGSDGGGGACFVRQVSDADSSTGACCAARQISDASSSSSSAGSSGNVGCGFEGEAWAGAFVGAATPGADALALGATAACAALAPAPGGQPWGGDPLTVVAGPHAGGSWRPRTAGGPRVKVRICSPRTGGNGPAGRRQRSMTVPPPWPPTVIPPSAVLNGWRGEPSTCRQQQQQQQREQEQRRRRRLRHLGVSDNDTEDGSLVSAVGLGFGLSDDAKMLIGMDRLRLVDPETASY